MTGSITPYLIIDGAANAIDWYRSVLGAEETSRMTGGAGRIAHAEIRIGGSPLFIGDEHVHYEGIHGPMRIGGTPVYLDLETVDVAGVFERAAEAAEAADLSIAPVVPSSASRAALTSSKESWGRS